MASIRKLNGLPNNLVQQFFSTLFYYSKGYMADWIFYTAKQNNVENVDIDIINETVTPKALNIKPIVSQLSLLRTTIRSVLTSNDFPADFIVKANIYVKLPTNKHSRFLQVKCITVDKNGKIYEGLVYSEKAYEDDNFNITFLDRIKKIFFKT